MANTVVRMPLQNAPKKPSRWASFVAALEPANPGIGISQTPKKLSAMMNTRPVSTTLKPVDWNCSPQPKFKNAASVASTRNTDNIPAEYQRFSAST